MALAGTRVIYIHHQRLWLRLRQLENIMKHPKLQEELGKGKLLIRGWQSSADPLSAELRLFSLYQERRDETGIVFLLYRAMAGIDPRLVLLPNFDPLRRSSGDETWRSLWNEVRDYDLTGRHGDKPSRVVMWTDTDLGTFLPEGDPRLLGHLQRVLGALHQTTFAYGLDWEEACASMIPKIEGLLRTQYRAWGKLVTLP